MSKTTKFYNQVEPKWVCIDAQDRVLGRLASRIALILQGKNKATYSPNFLCGDIVVVINAEKIKLTGKKVKAKSYDKYTGYANGRKVISFEELMSKNKTKALYLAVKRMLPKNTLAKKMLRNLKIYAGEQHPHQAQKPQKIEV